MLILFSCGKNNPVIQSRRSFHGLLSLDSIRSKPYLFCITIKLRFLLSTALNALFYYWET